MRFGWPATRPALSSSLRFSLGLLVVTGDLAEHLEVVIVIRPAFCNADAVVDDELLVAAAFAAAGLAGVLVPSEDAFPCCWGDAGAVP